MFENLITMLFRHL